MTYFLVCEFNLRIKQLNGNTIDAVEFSLRRRMVEVGGTARGNDFSNILKSEEFALYKP